jgi:beta-N-acetylhexosaminidase
MMYCSFKKKIYIYFAVFCFFTMIQAQSRETIKEARQWADETVAKLTLEKKIGQIICTDIRGTYISDDDPRLKQWFKLAGEWGVGGFVLYGGTPRDVAHLLNKLQEKAQLPILMAADFEGGPGQQIMGASEFPANMAFSAAGSEELMYEAAKIGAIEGRAMGIHLTYSPVVDVSLRPENPSESVRSFGGDINLLGRMLKAYVKGYQENGMLTTAKHFPGRGDVELIPDLPGFTFINKRAEDVESQEFRAFKHAIDAGVTYVMTEHIAIPSLTDGSKLPASVEKKLVTQWLRKKLNFTGIITTDDLWYPNVVKRFGAVEVAIKAIQAGHDVILKPKDPIATIKGLVEAVKSGKISVATINRSCGKILYQKALLKLHRNRFVEEDQVNRFVGTKDHLAVVQKVADLSLTLLKNDGILPIKPNQLKKIVNLCIQKHRSDPSPDDLTKKLIVAFPDIQNFILGPDSDPRLHEKIWTAVKDANLILLSLFIQRSRLTNPTPIRDKDLLFINKIIAAKPRAVIAMSYGNPHLIRKISKVPVFLVGYGEGGWFGNQTVYFDSFIKLLKGELKPKGKLPVRVSEKYSIGHAVGY